MGTTISDKLNRIKNLTTELRTTANMPYGPIEDVVATVDNNIKAIDNAIVEKNTTIAELQKDSSIFRAKKQVFVPTTVVNPKEGDVVVVIDQSGQFPQYQEYVSKVIVNSVVDFGEKTFSQWLEEFYAAYGSASTTVYFSLRSDDYNTADATGQLFTCQVRDEGSVYRIQMTYRDLITNNQLSCYFYVYEEDFESTTLTAQSAYYRDYSTGSTVNTNFLGGSHELTFPQSLKAMTNRDFSPLNVFLSFKTVSYDGAYAYDSNREEWTRMPIGMNLEPENVVSGTKFKTDEGEKIGTLGDDISTLESAAKIGQLFQKSVDGTIDVGTSLSANTVFKAIQKGTTLTPLFHTIDWASMTNYSSFLSNIEMDEFDLTKLKENILGSPTNLNSFMNNCRIARLNLSNLDVSKVTSISYNSAPWEQMSEWLTLTKTFNSLTGTSSGMFGSYGAEHSLLTIKNRTYPSLASIGGTFGQLSCPHILLENLHFGAEITGTGYLVNKTIVQSICIKNCTGITFKYYSNSSDKSSAYRYTFTDGYTQGSLKYLIFDIDYVLNFPAYFSYTPTTIRLDPRLRECDLYTNGYIYVRDNMVTSYKNSSYWSSFSSRIKPISEITQELKDIYGYNEEV